MKAVFRTTLLIAAFAVLAANSLEAQRVIKGTVYRDGEPAAGITVEAHRGGQMMTSFDGKYEVEAHEKTRWLKFTYINETKKLDNIDEKEGNVFDFAFTGEIPSGEEEEEEGDEVVLKSAEELIRDQNRDFMNELSLFTEFYKQDNYESALPHWKNVYNKYPKSTKNIYIRGAKIYEQFIETAEDPEERDKYIDQLMKIYDKRIKHFGEKGYVLGRKATSWLEYKLNSPNPPEGEALKETMKKGFEWLTQSMEEQQEETELPIFVLLMQTTRSLFKLGELPKETVIKNYNKCNNVLTNFSTDDEELQSDVQKVLTYIEEIFGSSGAADCEALVDIFTPQYEENKDDADFIKGMLRRLGNADCEESPLFSQATERLYELEPSAEAAFNMARRYVQRDDIERAKNYYQEAMEQETDEELLAKYYYEYAYFIFAKENSLQEARSYARRALDLDSDYCEALILIGDIYVAASNSFGEDDFEKSSVFWVAVDYFQRARRAGQDCAIDGSQKVNTYKRYFPNKEEAFFRGLQEGQTYKVGGWINETTKVRF